VVAASDTAGAQAFSGLDNKFCDDGMVKESNVVVLYISTQYGKHAFSTIIGGEDLPVRINPHFQSTGTEEMDQIAVRKCGECPIEKSAILPKGIDEFFETRLVGDVAPAAARQEQFVTQTVCLFNEGYFCAPLRCAPRCHHAGSASPHDNDVRGRLILFRDHLISVKGFGPIPLFLHYFFNPADLTTFQADFNTMGVSKGFRQNVFHSPFGQFSRMLVFL
jgi:hypothetical protein